jgi:hypothetical protein
MGWPASSEQGIHEPNNLLIRLMEAYNWQQKDWPQFKYSLRNVEDELFVFAENIHQLILILYAKSCSQLFIICHAAGKAMKNAKAPSSPNLSKVK